MIAFHFPPQRGSSGIQRTLKFSQYLPDLGWEPLVLSAHPRAYEQTGDDQMDALAPALVVRRAFALDTARHLSVKGRYPGALAVPDRWVSWLVGAVPAGLAMIRRHRPQVIWSTYPIATAHLIGLALHKLTGLPLVADLRDPMIDHSHPTGRLRRRVVAWVEEKTLQHCARAVCTTPGAVRMYKERFPKLPAERFCLIENGYDEQAFASVGPVGPAEGPFTLLHSGVVYPSERDPRPLFQALAGLLARGDVSPSTFQLVLRAPSHEAWLQGLIAQHGIGPIVTIAPPLPYREALAEMVNSGALLILQASNCNDQVPAKLYEYLRAGRPILALTDAAGDTAATLRAAGIDTIGPLDCAQGIADALLRFLESAKAGRAPLPSHETVRAHERHTRAVQLAGLLDEVAREANAAPGKH